VNSGTISTSPPIAIVTNVNTTISTAFFFDCFLADEHRLILPPGQRRPAPWIAGAGAMLGGRGCNRLEANDALASQHLSRAEAAGLAAKARALMVENDPDAIRTGLAEIADALDAISRQAA